jgi:hypothetical protein
MDKGLLRALAISAISTIVVFYGAKYLDKKNLLPKPDKNEK